MDSDRRRVTLTDIAFGGDCVGRIDNQVLFASYGLPGEEVIVEFSENKRDYRRGRVVEVIKPSPARVEPRCRFFGQCGGCRWQHIDYPTQVALKRNIVVDQLRRIGGFSDEVPVNPTLSAEQPWRYRNHARFTARKGQLGFFVEGSRQFAAVDECHIVHPVINKVLASVQGKLPHHLHQVAVRCATNTGQLLINPDPGVRGIASSTLGAAFTANGKIGQGRTYLEEEILRRRFRIDPVSFFQVNTPQAERMVRYIIEQLQPVKTDTVLDVYCGVGTFGLSIADKAARVIGIEESKPALRDARYNAREADNVEFILGAAEDVLAHIEECVDAAIIDPPRAGCKREVIRELRRLRPSRIVYVSCDPATLARDLKLFCADASYKIVDVQPVDMFPQTYHVESIILMTNSGSD